MHDPINLLRDDAGLVGFMCYDAGFTDVYWDLLRFMQVMLRITCIC